MPNWWGAGKAAPVQVATCWGEPSSRPPQCRSEAKCGGIARWGAKPRPVWRNARPPGFNGPRLSVDVVLIDCASKQAKAQVGAGWSYATGTGQGRQGRQGRPQADPAREAPTGAECKPVEARRSGAARPESDFGKRLRESLAIARICRSHSGECVKTAPKSRAGLSTKNATQ